MTCPCSPDCPNGRPLFLDWAFRNGHDMRPVPGTIPPSDFLTVHDSLRWACQTCGAEADKSIWFISGAALETPCAGDSRRAA